MFIQFAALSSIRFAQFNYFNEFNVLRTQFLKSIDLIDIH